MENLTGKLIVFDVCQNLPMLIQDGVFALVQDQAVLRGLSGVELIDNKIVVNNVLPDGAKPGQELYVRVKESLGRSSPPTRIDDSHVRTGSLGR